MKFIWNEPEMDAIADRPAGDYWKDVVITWLRYNNVCPRTEDIKLFYSYTSHDYIISIYERDENGDPAKEVRKMRNYLKSSGLAWLEIGSVFRYADGNGARREGRTFSIKAEDFFEPGDTSSSTFYAVVTSDSMTDGNGQSIAWETPIANSLTREQAAARQSEVTEHYGTSWIAKCEIIEDSRTDPKPVSRRELIEALNDAEKNTESSAAQSRSLRLLRRYMKQCEGENAD